MLLPPVKHSVVKSFWVVLHVLAGFSACLVLAWVAPNWMPFGVTMVLASMLIGLMPSNLSFLWLMHRGWNEVVMRFAKIMKTIILAICFFVVFVAVGRSTGQLRMNRLPVSQSLWTSRNRKFTTNFRSLSHVPGENAGESGWVSSFMTWAIHSKHFWALGLLPFLLLLSALGPEQNDSMPLGIYTLF